MNWLDTLPTLWTRATLGDLSRFVQYGLTATSQNDVNGIPFLRISDISDDGRLNLPGIKYIPRTTPDLAKYLLIPGDILIARSGSVGRSFLYEGTPEPAVFASYLIRFRLDEDIADPKYVAQFLQSPFFRQYIENVSRSVAQPNINSQELSRLVMPIPSLSEQRRIVDILHRADELRRLRREANERANDLLPALFQEAFGGSDSWENSVPLGKLVHFVGGGTPSRKVERYFQGTVPWATSKDIKSRYLADTQEHITEEAIANSATNLAPAGTILVVVKSKILIHTLPIGITTRPFCFGQDIKGLVCDPGVEPVFIASAMLAQSKAILQMARGVNTEGLTLEHLASIRVPKVSNKTQGEFLQMVEKYDALDGQLKTATEWLAHLVDSLMFRTFTGELTTAWRNARIEQLTQEAAERDQYLRSRAKRLLTRGDTLRAPDSRDLLAAETTLAKALDGVAQQIAGSTKVVSGTLEALAHSPVMAMAQQIQRQYAAMFDSLTLRAVRQIADDQQRILASMTEPLRQMTGVTQRVMEDLQPIQGLLAQFAEKAREALAEPDPSHPRYHLLRSLGREQHDLYLALQTAEGYLRPEAMAEESGLPLDTVQRDLDLLVTIGLAQQVNVATKPSDKLVYVPAYRRVRSSDNARLAMMERLILQESAP